MSIYLYTSYLTGRLINRSCSILLHSSVSQRTEADKDMETGAIQNNGVFAVSADPRPARRNKIAMASAILASLVSILLGYDNGVMSGAVIFIKEDLKISDTKLEIVAGIINVCSLFGCAAAGRTSDWIGRRYTIVFASLIFLVGALLMGLAPNYSWLMAGRIVAGVGVGYAMMIAPVYTAEISPAASRGFLTSFPEVFINFGVLLGYISNYAFAGLPLKLGWRVMLGAGAIPSVILACGIVIMPESPRWLVLKGRIGEARKVLSTICDSEEDTESRLADIKKTVGIPESSVGDIVEVPKRKKGDAVWKDLLLHPTPAVRRVLIASVGIQFFQQASGIDSVVLYSPRIFQKAGLTKKSALLGATVAVGFSKTVCVLISTFYLDRVGRRPILLASVGGMIVSLIALATGLTIVDHSDTKVTWAIVLCVGMTWLFVGSFSMGLGPIPWVYSSEIFPLKLRAQGVSIGVAVNRVTSGVVGMTFLSLYHAITIQGSFFMFAGITTIAGIFFYTFLPETHGKNLEDMEDLFSTSYKLNAFTGPCRKINGRV
ncbi:hypothetical protein NE237_017142 [Protea cynaroides]|uniref:Major facilitator superfamily (MFS) profile domain-containing protein n=1 Tax=Protea cynaroides TaxID=273540 RepID=A0A9Q0QMK5_9MAGN|nr:hypothetical protein NE237_017142 [Protea cynaroides]